MMKLIVKKKRKKRAQIELESPTKVYSKSKIPDNALKAYLVSPLLKKESYISYESSDSDEKT